jgi:hypothetical protein
MANRLAMAHELENLADECRHFVGAVNGEHARAYLLELAET